MPQCCQDVSLTIFDVGLGLHLTKGLVLAKRKDISSGQVSPVDSGE